MRSSLYFHRPEHDQPRQFRISIRSSVPRTLWEDAWQVEQAIPPSDLPGSLHFGVTVGQEALVIPSRIYCPPIDPEEFSTLSPTQQLIAIAVYTRHHDGYVREDCLRQLMTEPMLWTAAYVLKLVGEAVEEIVAIIDERLTADDPGSEALLSHMIAVAAQNPIWFRTIKSQTASYWGAYYRTKHLHLRDYPGTRIVNRMLASLPPSAVMGW